MFLTIDNPVYREFVNVTYKGLATFFPNYGKNFIANLGIFSLDGTLVQSRLSPQTH